MWLQVIINQPLKEHGEWSGKEFAPEKEFLDKLKAIEGVSRVEAQEYTLTSL